MSPANGHLRARSNKRYFRREQGQGLVEYGLILVLVAIVSIAAIRFLAPAVERVYAIVLGALGQRGTTTADITFDSDQLPRCGMLPGVGTGFYMHFYSRLSPDQIQVSTDNNIPLSVVADAIPNKYVIATMIAAGVEDLGKCPRSIAIQINQAAGSSVLYAPVEFRNW
jgi:pilus assembly protein Flp/PilA